MSDSGSTLSRIDGVGYINLRGATEDDGFLTGTEKVLQQRLPVDANTTTHNAHTCYWLGPDEWLIRSDADAVDGLLSDLDKALDGRHVAVNDLSGGIVGVQLSRPDARVLLARGCTLDLHESLFAVGACAQSGLGKANVLISLLDDLPTFELYVRRSFADYVFRWLSHASGEPGIEFP